MHQYHGEILETAELTSKVEFLHEHWNKLSLSLIELAKKPGSELYNESMVNLCCMVL